MSAYNFTERVRKALTMAREAAARLHHEQVGTEHLLLGLLGEGQGIAAAVLRDLGVDPDDLARKTLTALRPGTAADLRGADLPYTPRAKKVLELAMGEARHMEHNHVGTEHLLLGLMLEEHEVAGQVLRSAGLDADTLRADTVRLLGSGSGQSPLASQAVQWTGVGPESADPSMRVLAGITVEVHYTDGSSARAQFQRRLDAMHFLRQL